MTRTDRRRVASPSWLRLPRRSARLRLTLLSGALFLLAGVALLAVTFLLFAQDSSRVAVSNRHTTNSAVPLSTPGSGPPGSGSSESIKTTHHSIGSALQAGASAQGAADRHDLLIGASPLALAIVAAFALLLGWFVAGRTLRPLRTITATARRISASNLHERLALSDADEEFKELGDTLDDLFARLAAAFEAQQHFVANASHELRTPLTAERALLQVALDDPDTTNETWRSTAREVLASSDEQERLIEALLTLASSEGGLDHREWIDLATICDGILRRTDRDVQQLELHVETELYPAPVDGDPSLVERLVANLIDNAVGHNVPGGSIGVSTTVLDGRAVLTVVNTGEVISPADIDRLFQPFQRLSIARTHHKDGHGLGLSIVRAIVTAHDATLNAQALAAGGLSIQIAFPPAQNPSARDALEHTDRAESMSSELPVKTG